MSIKSLSVLLLVLVTFATGWLLGRQQARRKSGGDDLTLSQVRSNSLAPMAARRQAREPASASPDTKGRSSIQEEFDKALHTLGSRRNRALREFVVSLSAADLGEAIAIVEKSAPAADKSNLRGQLLTRWA